MRSITIKGLELLLDDNCDVEIDGDKITVKAKPAGAAPLIHEHYHYHSYLNAGGGQIPGTFSYRFTSTAIADGSYIFSIH